MKEERNYLCRGSLTVEAAFVFPLSFSVLFGILYLFLLMHTQFLVYQGMLAVSDKLYGLGTMAAYVENSGAFSELLEQSSLELPEEIEDLISGEVTSFLISQASTAYIQSCFEQYFEESSRNLSCIDGDYSGIEWKNSSAYAGDGSIVLQAEYTFKFPGIVFFFDDRQIVQTLNLTGFYGSHWEAVKEFEHEENSSGDENSEEYVYVTPNGTVYHLEDTCTYISFNLSQVLFKDVENLRNASGGKYYPCEYCSRGTSGINVYITEFGDRYHNSSSCSRITRDVTKVTKEQAEAEGKQACSKCGDG